MFPKQPFPPWCFPSILVSRGMRWDSACARRHINPLNAHQQAVWPAGLCPPRRPVTPPAGLSPSGQRVPSNLCCIRSCALRLHGPGEPECPLQPYLSPSAAFPLGFYQRLEISVRVVPLHCDYVGCLSVSLNVCSFGACPAADRLGPLRRNLTLWPRSPCGGARGGGLSPVLPAA